MHSLSIPCGVLAALALPVHAADLAACAALGDDRARLACYDALAGAPPASATPAPPATAPAAPTPAPPVVLLLERPREAPAAGELERRWELRPDLRQGTFRLLPYRAIYALARATSDVNDLPGSPTRPTVADGVDLDRVEAKLQLSFKTKLVEDAFGTGTDAWFGYTQQSYWQAANSRYSSPFRETNYQPEVVVVHALRDAGPFKYLGASLVHESNGRGESLSRSWNRVVGEIAIESGPWTLNVRPWIEVLRSEGERDDNPDIEDYIGRGELIAAYRSNGHVVTLAGRHTLRSGDASRGSARVDWAFPLAGRLNGHLQLFTGYGESLIDYNHSQTTVGLGLSFFD
ncbi:MAG TPA: phospholipase A [Casimicrobiaceae bacterium]|nr:phospholipase A [Casimicrobiaceae bacterium]